MFVFPKDGVCLCQESFRLVCSTSLLGSMCHHGSHSEVSSAGFPLDITPYGLSSSPTTRPAIPWRMASTSRSGRSGAAGISLALKSR
jgi:hypothetical protein